MSPPRRKGEVDAFGTGDPEGLVLGTVGTDTGNRKKLPTVRRKHKRARGIRVEALTLTCCVSSVSPQTSLIPSLLPQWGS